MRNSDDPSIALDDPNVRRVFVFGHPNHESVVLGLAQRLRPHLIYLTGEPDGERVAQTLESLATIGLADRATFLDHDEERFYEALLAGDAGFFEGVAADLGEALAARAPRQVLCDAVEYYNPVHDLTLPIVRAALRAAPEVDVFALPIIFQAPGPGGFRVQRVADEDSLALRIELRPEELARKEHAVRHVYTRLAASMGAVAEAVTKEHMAVEHVAVAPTATPEPTPATFLRYEERGRRLQEQGQVEHVITWADHYRPVAQALMAAAQ